MNTPPFPGPGAGPDPALKAKIDGLVQLLNSGKFALAESRSRKLLKKHPQLPVLYQLVSAAQMGQGNNGGVVETLAKALQLQPGNLDWRYNHSVALMNLNRLDQAIDGFSAVVEAQPGHADAWTNLGVCHFEVERFEEAISAYEKAVELQPDLVPALRNYGQALRDLGRLEESESVLSKIPLLQPRFAAGHLSLGVTQLELGKMEKARASFEAALKLEPDLKEAHYFLGDLLHQEGKLQEVEAHFSKVDTPETRARLCEIDFELGRNQEDVVARLRKTNEADPYNRRASAFCAYATDQYGIENFNAFSADPLAQVDIRNVRDHLQQQPDFMERLMASADEAMAVWENRTTRGGFQTYGNLFHHGEVFGELDELLRAHIRDHVSERRGSGDGYINRYPKKFELFGWRVKVMRSGYQRPHIHPGGWMSGVLYLKMPEKMSGNEGSIAFSLHGYDYPKLKEDIPYFEHLPQEGDLVFFPSSLFHWTIPFDSDEERQCIAFDVVPLDG